MDKEGSQLIRGLEGVVAAETKLCDLDGQNGRLAYGGYHIDDLARPASFAEVCQLPSYGEPPNAAPPRRARSTRTDMHPAGGGGVGALKGPVHGGAGEAVMRTLREIGEVGNVAAPTEKALTERRRFMGMGHRVYKAGDPRAAILKGMAEEACRQSGQFKWYEMAVKLHARIKEAKKLIPNVDFYSAPLFYSLEIPVDLFTPVIAAGRIAGWTANIIEQHDDNRLIRPRGDYIGPGRRAWTPLDKR